MVLPPCFTSPRPSRVGIRAGWCPIALVQPEFCPSAFSTLSYPSCLRTLACNIPSMTDAFPSALVGPSAKERKYDRQLRLWAASGQQALEESRVLLVSSDGPIGPGNTGVSGVVGIETLKNLVLPGIGGFTIVDPATVAESDLGLNFFLEEGSLGKSRAEETCRLLKELNPDVEGHFSSKVILRRRFDLIPLACILMLTKIPNTSRSESF